MHTTDVGRAFFHVIRIRPNTRFFHTAPTVEIDPPYRRSESLIIRIPFTRRALVLGWWEDTGWDSDEALMEAVRGWGIDPYDDSLDKPEIRQTIRENVAEWSRDTDSEWQVINVLGVQ